MMEARTVDRFETPFQRNMKPATVTVVVDLPAPGFIFTIPLIKVPSGFIFNSTHFGIMMDLQSIALAAQCTTLMNSVRDMIFELRANGKAIVNSEPLPAPHSTPVFAFNSTYRSINVSSWAFGSPDPADFYMTIKENELIDLTIQNVNFAPNWPIVTPRLLVRLDGWYSEYRMGNKSF